MNDTPEPTRIRPNPSDSVLLTLARAALAQEPGDGEATWPHLDLDDPAQRAFGDYELLEEIGRGGMGTVYRARQQSLDREVAIKFIAAGLADPANVARFLSEARAAARLVHPNIVPVFEVGAVDGIHYFSMPLIAGRTLAELLAAGALPTTQVVRLLLALCEATDYAHRLGLLHLDLKPANVLIDERGEPLITDFGLARRIDANGGVDAQEVSGTPAFMAPEQILIRQYRLTTATDIYALGAILYRCLTGVSPHGEGQSDDVIRRAAAGRVRPPRAINPAIARDLDAICMKCLELQPSDRYPSAGVLADDLRRVRDGLPVSVRRIGALERMQRWFKREPKLAFASTAALLALVLGIAATTWQWREAGTQRDAAVTQRNTAETARKEAVEQRDIAQGVAALGAWLYAQHQFGDKDTTGGYDTTVRLLEWLRTRYPGDEHRQATVLAAFAQATEADGDDTELGDRWATDGLLPPVIHVLGKPYREQMIAALVSGKEANRYLLAAQLASNSEDMDNFTELMNKAIAEQPNDPSVWEVMATYCATTEMQQQSVCHNQDAARRLTELAPDNAYPWLLLMMASEGNAASAAMHEAAQRSHFDDTFRSRLATYMEAVAKAHVPAQELLVGPAQALSPNTTPEFAIAAGEFGGLALAQLRPFWERCNPAKGYFKNASTYADCRIVGTRMARSNGSALTIMVGATVAQRLSRGTSLEQEMIEVRSRLFYVHEATSKLSLRQYRNYSFQKYHEDFMALGELEAWENRLAYYGLPARPPKDWQPSDPRAILLPEERAAYDSAQPQPQ